MNLRQSIITAIILFLFAVAGAAMVAFTFESTREKIAANERATLMRKLNQLIAPDRYDNNLLDDTVNITDARLPATSGPVTVYRARMNKQPVALVMTPVAPDGYNGSIKLLVGINHDGTLTGVRVVSHRETPGLGDGIDEDRSDWIYTFDGKSLDNPVQERWEVRRDGGYFDQFTGATITPRAVVKAVRQSLLYYQQNSKALFDETTVDKSPNGELTSEKATEPAS